MTTAWVDWNELHAHFDSLSDSDTRHVLVQARTPTGTTAAIFQVCFSTWRLVARNISVQQTVRGEEIELRSLNAGLIEEPSLATTVQFVHAIASGWGGTTS